MSFDIFFQSGRFGTTTVQKKNPWTGETQSVLPSEPLTASELKAVQDVLRKVTDSGPDQFGCYVVALADGGGAEVFGDNLEKGWMVAVRGLLQTCSSFSSTCWPPAMGS
jgi:hypothetical protein